MMKIIRIPTFLLAYFPSYIFFLYLIRMDRFMLLACNIQVEENAFSCRIRKVDLAFDIERRIPCTDIARHFQYFIIITAPVIIKKKKKK